MATPETNAFQTRDRRDDFPVFIHSELDDYGLNNVEFRVYSRLARRAGQSGRHSESVPNMAREFDVSVRTIQYALKILTACRLITRHARPGKTDEYSMNPRAVWQSKSLLISTRAQLKPSGATTEGTPSGATRDGGATGDRGVVQPEHGVVVQPEIDEGTPSEGTPKKVEEVDPRGHPFNHFAVVEYEAWFKTELSDVSAETIADTVTDNPISRIAWSDVLRTFKGNGYRARNVGNALDRYVNDLRKIESGLKDSPLPTTPERKQTIRERLQQEGVIA
jgi:hypothetical protein